MDSCFVDIAVEFFGVAFHNILYYTSVYPKSIFETRKKYSVVVYRSTHPEVNQYIDLCLKSIAECLKTGALSRVELCITDDTYQTLFKFVFDLERNVTYDDTADAYLVQSEQNLRAFCLHLSSISDKLTNLDEDRSFTIHLHTNESTAVGLSITPELEDFPLVEAEKGDDMDKLLPLRRFSIRNFSLDAYVEIR